MTSKLKTLGLAVFAITALSAVMASAAQAGTLDFGANPAVFTGTTEIEEPKFNITKTGQANNFNSICQSATLEGTVHQVTGGQTPAQQQVHDVTATPTYGTSQTTPTGCTLFGQAMHVKVNGCKFTLTGAGEAANTARVDIVGCTPGKQIEVNSAVCQLLVPEQNGLSHVFGTEPAVTTTPHTVTLDATVSGITFTQFGACPDGNNHHGTNGSFTAKTTIKAFVDDPAGGAQHTKFAGQITEHQYQTVKEGSQTSITST